MCSAGSRVTDVLEETDDLVARAWTGMPSPGPENGAARTCMSTPEITTRLTSPGEAHPPPARLGSGHRPTPIGPDQEPDMTVITHDRAGAGTTSTSDSLVRAAGLCALIAGSCYVVVGIFHPA